jgi:hypothetical protein
MNRRSQIVFASVVALAAALLPTGASATEPALPPQEIATLVLERVEVDGVPLADRSVYDGVEVELVAGYGDGTVSLRTSRPLWLEEFRAVSPPTGR